MALAVDALVAAHDAHREHPVRAHEPSSSRPIAPALTVVGRERSHARRERSRNPRPRARHCQRVRYPRPRWRERTRGRPCGAQTRGISPDESLLRDTRRRVCWTSATRGQRADEDRGSQGLPGVDDRSCSGRPHRRQYGVSPPGARHRQLLTEGRSRCRLGRLQRREALDTSEVRLRAGSRSRGLGRNRRGGKRRWREDSRSVRYDGRPSG